MKSNFDKDITFEIIDSLGVIHTYPNGWRKELTLISWNGTEPKYDIRDWDPNMEYMSKGISLTAEQAVKVYEILRNHFNDEGEEIYESNNNRIN